MALVTNQQHHEQVRQLLTEAVIALCKNMLTYSTDLCIEGLIGVTTDSTNVILVNIKETISQAMAPAPTDGDEHAMSMARDHSHQTQLTANFCENRQKSIKSKGRCKSDSSEQGSHLVATESEQVVSEEKQGELHGKCILGEVPSRKRSHGDTLFILDGSVKSIKQELDPNVPMYNGGDHLSSVAEERCNSPGQSENHNLPVPAVWHEVSEVHSSRLSLTLPEASHLPWSHAKGSFEQIDSQEAVELLNPASVSLPHSNRSHFPPTRDKNLLLQQHQTQRDVAGDCTKKIVPLSFTIEQDPSRSSELFVCECGEPFRHRSSLYRHQMMHLGMAYRCDSCGIVMNRKDNLLTHKRRYCLAQKQLNSKF